MRKRKKLKSGFSGGEVATPKPQPPRSDVPIARRKPLAYWEDLPRMGPETILAEPERARRKLLFLESHPSTFADRCGDVWPPMPLAA